VRWHLRLKESYLIAFDFSILRAARATCVPALLRYRI